MINKIIDKYYKDDPMRPMLILTVTPRQIFEEMLQTSLSSADYVTLKLLHDGETNRIRYRGAELVC